MSIQPDLRVPYGVLIQEIAKKHEGLCAALSERSRALDTLTKEIQHSKSLQRAVLTDRTQRAHVLKSDVMSVAQRIHRYILEILDRRPLNKAAYQGLSVLGYEVKPIREAVATLQLSQSLLLRYERPLKQWIDQFKKSWSAVEAALDKAWVAFPAEVSPITLDGWMSDPPPFPWRNLHCVTYITPCQLTETPLEAPSVLPLMQQQILLSSKLTYPNPSADTAAPLASKAFPEDEPCDETPGLDPRWTAPLIVSLNEECHKSDSLYAAAQAAAVRGQTCYKVTLPHNLKQFQRTSKKGPALTSLDTQIVNAHGACKEIDQHIQSLSTYHQQFTHRYLAARSFLLTKDDEETLAQLNVPMRALKQFRHLITRSQHQAESLLTLQATLISTKKTLTASLHDVAKERQASQGNTSFLDFNRNYVQEIVNASNTGPS